MSLEGRWIDTWVMVETGVPKDIGWGTVVLNEDMTVTRTCKGCGASVTSAVVPDTAKVMPMPLQHKDDCTMWPRLRDVRQG